MNPDLFYKELERLRLIYLAGVWSKDEKRALRQQVSIYLDQLYEEGFKVKDTNGEDITRRNWVSLTITMTKPPERELTINLNRHELVRQGIPNEQLD